MIATVKSGAIVGIEAYLVQVEVDVASRGLPKFSVVGLSEAFGVLWCRSRMHRKPRWWTR